MKEYSIITVESYKPEKTSGLHGKIHIRPIKGELYGQNIHVECSKTFSNDYPVGTKFKIKVKLTSRENGKQFLYNHYSWKPIEIIYP